MLATSREGEGRDIDVGKILFEHINQMASQRRILPFLFREVSGIRVYINNRSKTTHPRKSYAYRYTYLPIIDPH